MSEITTVDGLDVRPGMRIRFSGKGGGVTIAKVTGAARHKSPTGGVTNLITAEANGRRFSVELRAGQTFTVAR